MAARAIWKGQLKLGTTKIPVKLYSAVQDQTVRFHILDEKNKQRVKQHMVDPDSGEEVPSKEIQKGYEVEPGKCGTNSTIWISRNSRRRRRAISKSSNSCRKTRLASSGTTGLITWVP